MVQYRRSMGLDVGSKTVGVALSDLMGWTAQGLKIIRIDEENEVYGFDEVVAIAQENQVDTIVIGLPKNMNNTIGPRAEASMFYGEQLQQLLPDMTIVYQDERLTTSQAERMLITEGNVSRQKRKKVIDKLAAVIILQNYLDQQSHKGV